ncbi:beta-N-acetylglucosaminidase domain-containing protein [Anaeromassilibacillus sp. An172]|uniref:beta-N-acetylglucosaminidase domain-containing protein n=1 Tax=Anaeromassilibacillus sp. An172 TaxID=1965570 RepID=UPI001302AA10|nr:beta-N-acetylglucosaminidase domain-containing protein [Anaeromassilibacillus sp. An172]
MIIFLTVEDGVLKVTKPETTAEVELTAKISYNDNEYDYVIKVKVLSQQDIDNTYDINPTPHSLVMNYKTIDFDNVKVFYETGITEVTKSRVNEIMEKQGVAYEVVEDYSQSTLALGIKDSAEAVDQNTAGYDSDLFTVAETKYDIHYIDINENGRVTILGEDDDAVYYGLATLDEAMTTVDDQLYMNRLNSVYGTDLDVVDGIGILSNPMNQAEASKVSLYGVADYTWNTANFNAQENWEESFCTYTDDVAMAEALRTFASYASKDQDYTDIKSVFDKYRQDKSNYAFISREHILQQILSTEIRQHLYGFTARL